jgi:very-short-patch-repair endonuclease
MPTEMNLRPAMRASSSSREIELSKLAGRQHGVVAHGHLVALGFSSSGIQRRVSAGRLHRLYLGVYSVGHVIVSAHGHRMAAVLACGPGSVASHVSAAALRGLLSDARGVVDVTATIRRRHRGIAVHTVQWLHDDDRAVVDNIPVTSVSRTLLDLAGVVPNRLERALEQAERLGIFDLRAVEALMDRSRGRRGLRVLKAALRTYRDRPFTRSELERMLSEISRAADLPIPAFNVWIAGHEVDAVWHDHRVVVELDGYEFHRTRAAFERDRRRDADLQLAGYRIVRFTRRRLVDEPAEVTSVLRELLAVTPRQPKGLSNPP